MHPSIIISVFSFVLTLFIATYYWILRVGLPDNSVLDVMKALGFGALVMLLPAVIATRKPAPTTPWAQVFLNDSIISLYVLLMAGLLGYVAAVTGIELYIVFVLAGYACAAILIYRSFGTLNHFNKLFLIAIGCFFGLWVASVCWLLYLKPFIMEGWACGTDKLDTLFHVAIGQMIKTYGVPTTGLDGIPFMNYHWGSHWLFAQLSNFLNVPVVVIYQLVFPAIIAPLLFRTFLSFIIEAKQYFQPEAQTRKVNFFFWIIFLAVFIGFFKSYRALNDWAEYSSGGTSHTLFMLISESYTVSVTIMMIIFSVSVSFWMNRAALTHRQRILFLFALLPALLALLGWVKISTLFVVCCLLGYLFLRLRMFKSAILNASMVLLILTAFATFLVVFEVREDHGSLAWLFFYRNFNVSIPLFFLVFYAWAYIFIIVYFLKDRFSANTSESSRSKSLLPVECVLVVAISGFLPTAFLRIQNYDALYFTELHMFIAAALVLLYIPFFDHGYRFLSRRTLLLALPTCLLAYIFLKNTSVYAYNVLGDSVNHHACLLNNIGIDTDKMRIRHIVQKTIDSGDKLYINNKVLAFLQRLKDLDTLSLEDKKSSLVYVDFRSLIRRSDYQWKLGCHNIPFVVPALSGMAMIDGIDVTYFELCGGCCEQIGLSYQYYPKWKNREQIDAPFNVANLSARVREKGFDNLIFYNLQTELFEKVKVN